MWRLKNRLLLDTEDKSRKTKFADDVEALTFSAVRTPAPDRLLAAERDPFTSSRAVVVARHLP